MARPKVLITEGSDPAALQWLRERVDVVECRAGESGFEAHLASADGLIVRTYTKVNAGFLDAAPRLKVVGRGGVGIDNIDVAECRQRGVEVVYTPDANTLAVGDYVFGAIIRLVRDWPVLPAAGYDPARFRPTRDAARGRQLNELTLGILGMGRVGRRVGGIAAGGFGMPVIYNDLLDVAGELSFPARAVDKPTLYAQADILSIHVDMRPGNRNLVAAPQIAQMKPGSLLINASRGEVLDAHALADALKARRLAGAAVDVYAPEPPDASLPLFGLDNVLLTPHIASRTETALANMSWVVRDVHAALCGQRPAYPAA